MIYKERRFFSVKNANVLSPTEHSSRDCVVQGLMMVKPHAVERGLGSVIEGMMRHRLDQVSRGFERDWSHGLVDRIEAQESIPRDLRVHRAGKDLLDLFYGDKSNRRYYPLIREWYTGRVLFIPFELRTDDPKSVPTDLDALKGTTSTISETGDVVDSPLGIRGVLGTTYVTYSQEILSSMNEEEYRNAIRPVIQNFIHVCDKPGEASEAIQLIG